MQPYYAHAGIEIYHGDCRDILPALREKPALVLADPPFGERLFNRYRTGGTRSRATIADDLMHCEGNEQPFDPSHILALQTSTVLWGANYYTDKLPLVSSWLVWDKREGGTSDDNADCEMAWTNLGGPARLFSHKWRGMIKASERDEQRLHPNQKPVALMRWCLTRARLERGALVLDPYMGSGPVAQACKEMGYRYIGIELVESYCEAAALRLQQEVMELV